MYTVSVSYLGFALDLVFFSPPNPQDILDRCRETISSICRYINGDTYDIQLWEDSQERFDEETLSSYHTRLKLTLNRVNPEPKNLSRYLRPGYNARKNGTNNDSFNSLLKVIESLFRDSTSEYKIKKHYRINTTYLGVKFSFPFDTKTPDPNELLKMCQKQINHIAIDPKYNECHILALFKYMDQKVYKNGYDLLRAKMPIALSEFSPNHLQELIETEQVSPCHPIFKCGLDILTYEMNKKAVVWVMRKSFSKKS
jgi:hypothetical protein